MATRATSVQEYLAHLPADRRKAHETLRKVIRRNLGRGFQETLQYGMIGYSVPHALYPAGYHCDPAQPLPFASIASQKNHLALYLFCIYCDPQEQARFVQDWKRAGHKLDMGKSCVRFKRIEDVPLDVVGAAIGRMSVEGFIAAYESAITPAARAALEKRKAALAAQGAGSKSASAARSRSPGKKVAGKAARKKAARKRA
jgi:hypothetical protein